MRTTIDIDEDLLKRAMTYTGFKSKSATVNYALAYLLKFKGDEDARRLGSAWIEKLDHASQRITDYEGTTES